MPSHVWGRDPQEAFEEPYEYGIQEQFARESQTLFTGLYKLLNSERHRYSAEDRSREKAVWMLAMDALDSLRECLDALTGKKHRVAGNLFRHIIESIDLAAYFHSATDKSKASLDKWYADEIVVHKEYRDYVKRTQGAEEAEHLRKHYVSLSRFTHRSYGAILHGYSIGAANRLVHDRSAEIYGTSENGARALVLPQTVASYYAVLANLTMVYAAELSKLGLVRLEEIRNAFAESWEPATVARRFLPRRWLVERLRASPGRKQGT
jgi:hypothetical protein